MLDAAVARALRLAALPARGLRARRRDGPAGAARARPARRASSSAGARVFEHSRVRALRAGPDVVAETAGGSVRAGAAVLAVNAAARGVAPLRRRLAVTSSHIVLTEPVPDVLEPLGWTGGESITDARTFLHYFRTTTDGRIAFGWGGGRLAAGARLNGRDRGRPGDRGRDPPRTSTMLPGARGPQGHARVGRPDRRVARATCRRSAARRRTGALRLRLHRQRRRPVAPRRPHPRRPARRGEAPDAALAGAPAPVPPEPIAWAGGMLVRAAFLRRERLEAEGRRADPLTRALTAAPTRARHPRRALIAAAPVR